MSETNPTIGYMVRCKCGAAARVNVPAVRIDKSRRVGGIVGVPGSATFEKYTVREERFEADSFLLGWIQAAYSAHRRCWACGGALKVDRVKGTFSAVHVCGAKCMASKGPSCECSCGGKNHGKSYSGEVSA